jgi:tellurite methyltransferase
MSNARLKWDSIYKKKANVVPEPVFALSHYAHLLPPKGKALDLACGQGGNSFFLAKKGLHVDAWDVSSVVIQQISDNADTLNIAPLAIDINEAVWPTNHYDVIAVSKFLNRDIIPQLIRALKENGLVFYQTFTTDKAQTIGPTNPEFLLNKSELLSLFSSLSPVIYHEEAHIGNVNEGIRNEAILIAQKTKP